MSSLLKSQKHFFLMPAVAIAWFYFLSLNICSLPLLPATAAPASASKDHISGVISHFTTGWGVYDIKACSAGIRIQSQTGAILIATPPDWTVIVFRPKQKKAAKMSYAMFRTKNRFAVKLSNIREKPRIIRTAGINAVQFTFYINSKLDETTSLTSLYRSQQKEQIVLRKELAFACDKNDVPKQAKEIWRSYFESPVVEEIPISTILYMASGERRVLMDTKTFKRGMIKRSDFVVPSGLSYTGQFVEMIYGKEMEGVADLLLEP